ncbi:hypothetical protein THAOC_00088 [Thalassiosira oceanica]|uniref:Uncharacterized protein n=1 Tax=Thalassiosira oceanica TaxID=159749 RepID=K0TPL0_THAOC|nr:hypothetical protein THAOC_00088 [Thalassiosira oceanica]|eukprot:EJK78036.1 hypothetical protein THAOC_00088 [Thalassiosira oceanica]
MHNRKTPNGQWRAHKPTCSHLSAHQEIKRKLANSTSSSACALSRNAVRRGQQRFLSTLLCQEAPPGASAKAAPRRPWSSRRRQRQRPLRPKRLMYGGGNIGNAASFQRAQNELATLVGTSGENGAALGVAAICSCKAPALTEPADLPDNAKRRGTTTNGNNTSRPKTIGSL